MEILRIENLTFTYPLAHQQSLQDISFSVSRGDFVTVCGATGSGKTTLLKLLKRELMPHGTQCGEVFLKNIRLSETDEKTAACAVGYVMQCPKQQLVTDTVWHELAFGLENMGIPKEEIRRRVAEMSCWFGIEPWFTKRVEELSGGQQQLLNLASVLLMQPEVLLLDEPTAQLDPVAAADFMRMIEQLHRELGLTILMTEHRLEEALSVSNRLLVLEEGKLLAYGETKEVIQKMRNKEALMRAMPAAVRLYTGLTSPENTGDSALLPLTVREGREFIEQHFDNRIDSLVVTQQEKKKAPPAIVFRNVHFRYDRALPEVLSGVNFEAAEGETVCILGGNGSGKTTFLSVAAGLFPYYYGKIEVFGRSVKKYENGKLYQNCLSMLPQDVQTVFLRNTVREELEDAGALPEYIFDELKGLFERHPYDLSGGEQQLLALAKVLSKKPRLLLLDEPLKGLDAAAKQRMTEVFRKLKDENMTLLIVTHDVETAVELGDRLVLFFRGEIVSEGTKEEFCLGNQFYTTAVNRMTRGYFRNVVTTEDVIRLCLLNRRKDATGHENL